MHTERVTFLASPQLKSMMTGRASARGVSMGEYVRSRMESDDELTPEQEEEFAFLVKEISEAVPAMQASLERSVKMIEATSREIDQMLREAGLRK